MLEAQELLLRAREYRQNLAPQDAPRSALTHDEELHLLQMKFKIVDRLVKDCGSPFDDHQVFSVTATTVATAVADSLKDDPLLAAIFADLSASVELTCRSPISEVQIGQLARLIRRAGDRYFRSKCYVHAAACYGQSQRAFRKLDAFDEAQEAEYRLRLSAWRSRRSTLSLLTGFGSNLLFGFGFRPYRVLWGVLAVILVFGAVYYQLIPAAEWDSSLFMSLYGYFGILGKGDLVGESVAVRTLLVLETFIALVLNSTLVALLAKRWFRL